MKICFASLRKKVNYTDVLEYGMDVFYEAFRYYVKNNPQHQYSYYNFAFGKGAVRDNNVIKEADVIIFPAVEYILCKCYAPTRYRKITSRDTKGIRVSKQQTYYITYTRQRRK